MQFALSTHLFHGERLTRAHLEAIHGAGFSDVELFATATHFDYHDDRAIAGVADDLQSIGLTASSMHAPICASFAAGRWGPPFSNASPDATVRQRAVLEAARAVDACRSLGATILVLHLGLPSGQRIPAGDNDRRAAARSLEEIAEATARANVRLALELIQNPLSTPDALLDWIAGLELDSLGICLDIGHAHLMGEAPDEIEALGGHVLTTHLHDNRKTTDDHLVPFAGSVPWTATLAALWKIGYGGRLVFEVADQGDAAGVLDRTIGARARLQAILDDLAAPFDFESSN